MTATAVDLLPLPRFAPKPRSPLAAQVLPGLHAEHKTLPRSLYFDEAGVALLDQISSLPDWYIDRACLDIASTRREELSAAGGPGCTLLDDPSDPTAATRTLRATLPFRTASTSFRRITLVPDAVFGALHPTEAAALLMRARRVVGADGAILLGVDRVKSPHLVEAAYDDSTGLHARLNHHVLERINTELEADFDVQLFRHMAFYDDESRRVETHLVSVEPQVVHVAEEPVFFDEGESIWTASAYQYDLERLTMVTRLAGLAVEHLWTDSNEHCWLAFLTSARRN